MTPSTGGRLRCWAAHRRCALGGPLNTPTGIGNRSITPAGTHFTHRAARLKFGLRGPRPATNQAPRIRGFLLPPGLACDLRWPMATRIRLGLARRPNGPSNLFTGTKASMRHHNITSHRQFSCYASLWHGHMACTHLLASHSCSKVCARRPAATLSVR